MVDPLNTKAGQIEAQPLRALPMPGTMPVSGSTALPAVDGGEIVEQLETVINAFHLDRQTELADAEETGERPDLWQEEVDVPVVLLAKASALISSQKQEIARLIHERDEYQTAISSPEAVIANMKRGGIPVPSIRFLIDLHGEAALATWDKASASESRVQSLEEEVKVLREALKPFAEYAPYVDMFVKGRAAQGGSPLLPTKHFRLSHFQAASAALKENDRG